MDGDCAEYTRLRDSARYVRNQQSFRRIQCREKAPNEALEFPHEKQKQRLLKSSYRKMHQGASISKFLGRFPALRDKQARFASMSAVPDLVNSIQFSESSKENPFRKVTKKDQEII